MSKKTFNCRQCNLPFPLKAEGGPLGSGECINCYTKRVMRGRFVSLDEDEDYQKTLDSLRYWEL